MQKVAVLGLVGNAALIGGILYRRQQHLTEEEEARVKWEAARTDADLHCFFTAKQYLDQCSHEPDDQQECVRLALSMDECRRKLAELLPAENKHLLPAERPAMLRYPH